MKLAHAVNALHAGQVIVGHMCGQKCQSSLLLPGLRTTTVDKNSSITATSGSGRLAQDGGRVVEGCKQEDRVGGKSRVGSQDVSNRVSAGVTIPCLASRLRVSGP